MPLWKKAPPDRSSRPKSILAGHDGSAEAVAIAPDGTWLATTSWDGTARIWAADGKPRATLTGHKEAVEAVAIAPDGTWLATASHDQRCGPGPRTAPPAPSQRSGLTAERQTAHGSPQAPIFASWAS